MRLIHFIVLHSSLILFFCNPLHTFNLDWHRDPRCSPQTLAFVACGVYALYHGGYGCYTGIQKMSHEDNPAPGFLYSAASALYAIGGIYLIVQAPNITSWASFEGVATAWLRNAR